MSLPGGTTLYKKREGFLTLSVDQKMVTWGPPGAAPSQTIAISEISNLQQTPATSAKVILKIIAKNEGGDTTNHLFQFTSPDSRAEADAIKMVLTKLMTDLKGNDPSIPRPSATPAPSVTSAPLPKPSMPRWMDDNALKLDIELQQSLMKKDSSLHVLYMDGRAAKADSVSDSAWNLMFWSQRIELLRAHAIETEQRKGFVNILSVVKPKTDNGELKLNMSVEQTQQIFEQHPLIRRIYDEFVPKKLPQRDFWSRFFLSKLSKKLRGERITDHDPADLIFDRFLDGDNFTGITTRIGQGHVPHAIDIEGNEENQGGFKGGNRPDVEMRPGRKNAGLVSTLNSISSKIMANVAPSDPMALEDPAAAGSEQPARDGDAALQVELSLHDLEDSQDPESIPLKIQDQSALASAPSADVNADLEDDAKVFGGRTPAQALAELRSDINAFASGKTDIHTLIGVNDDSDSDSDGEDGKAKGTKKRAQDEAPRVGSKKARQAAQNHIINAILGRRIAEYGSQDAAVLNQRMAANPSASLSADEAKADKRAKARAMEATAILSPEMDQKTTQTHATCTEFLRQFHSAFFSGNPDRAVELEGVSQSLRRSKDRIMALAEEAELERQAAYEIEKTKARELYKKTGQKIYPRKDLCPGGREAVIGRFQAMLDCLDRALERYAAALEKEGLRPTVED